MRPFERLNRIGVGAAQLASVSISAAGVHDRHEAIIAPFLEDLVDLAMFREIVTLTPFDPAKAAAFWGIGTQIGEPVAGVAQGILDN